MIRTNFSRLEKIIIGVVLLGAVAVGMGVKTYKKSQTPQYNQVKVENALYTQEMICFIPDPESIKKTLDVYTDIAIMNGVPEEKQPQYIVALEKMNPSISLDSYPMREGKSINIPPK